MTLRTIPRIAVTGSLRLVRLPLDAAVAILPGNEGPAAAVELALDRADANVRTIAAMVLGDEVLREDAQRRFAAADERERALRLRTEAERTGEEADEELAERERQADRRRREAAEQAVKQRDQAKRRSAQRKDQAREAAQKRAEASRKAAAKVDEAVEQRAERERLNALDTKAAALEKTDEALTAADEAARLGDAAARAKTARKNGS